MAYQLMPSSGQDEVPPRPCSADGTARSGHSDVDLRLPGDSGIGELGVRAGESDPGRMLAWVLLIVVAAVVAGLVALVVWLV